MRKNIVNDIHGSPLERSIFEARLGKDIIENKKYWQSSHEKITKKIIEIIAHNECRENFDFLNKFKKLLSESVDVGALPKIIIEKFPLSIALKDIFPIKILMEYNIFST